MKLKDILLMIFCLGPMPSMAQSITLGARAGLSAWMPATVSDCKCIYPEHTAAGVSGNLFMELNPDHMFSWEFTLSSYKLHPSYLSTVEDGSGNYDIRMGVEEFSSSLRYLIASSSSPGLTIKTYVGIGAGISFSQDNVHYDISDISGHNLAGNYSSNHAMLYAGLNLTNNFYLNHHLFISLKNDWYLTPQKDNIIANKLFTAFRFRWNIAMGLGVRI